MSRDNEYRVRVYSDDSDDGRVTPLQRALHAELCRVGTHPGSSFTACLRAFWVCKRWESDGRPQSEATV